MCKKIAHYILQEDGTHANNRNRTQSLAQGEPAGGVREEGLAFQLVQIQPFGLFHVMWGVSEF